MATESAHHPTASTAIHRDAHATDDGADAGARITGWFRQMFCGLHGHDHLMQFKKNRVFLQCSSCGHESPGWVVKDTAPKTAHDETRQQILARGIS